MHQKNNLIIALSLLALGACSKSKPPQALATLWQEKNSIDEQALLREVASSNSLGMCLQDNFNSTTLKKEIADYESRYKGSSPSGFWKHIDLSTLPVMQANFLKEYGTEIGDLSNPESIDYSGCTDLPCIFNRIYKKGDDHVAGYVHYIWYLKFRSYLSADNKVPMHSENPVIGIYNNKVFDISAYLYNDEELFGLWRITHLLKEPFTSLTNLKEIQRIPRGEPIQGYSNMTCGLASSLGHIRLNDGCLTVDSKNSRTGFLYLGVIHEMGHMIDYLEGKGSQNFYRSYNQDYLDVAGFYKVEYTDRLGALISEWKMKPNAKAIRDYAATSPVENFADTLAYFRQDSKYTKERIDTTQFSWFSSNYYHGEVFDPIGNRSRYLQKYRSIFSGQILSKVVDCSSSNKAYNSNFFSPNDFPNLSLTPWMLKCMGAEAEAMANNITARVKTFEIEGCSSLNSRDDQVAWNTSLKHELTKQFEVYVNEIAKDPEYIAKVKEFSESLKNRSMANEAIFQCYNGSTLSDLSACYQSKVLEISLERATTLKLPENQAIDMSELYLATHPYSDVTNDLYQSYRAILNSHQELVEHEADSLWNSCLNIQHNDDQAPIGRHFVPRGGYLVSSFFNCLNTELPSTLTGVVRLIEFEGQKIIHPTEESIILEFLKPRVTDLLNNFYTQSKAVEAVEIPIIFEQLRESIVTQLESDFSWVKNLSNESFILKNCEDESFKLVDHLPLYHVKREIFKELIYSGSCRDIVSGKKYNEFISNSKNKVETELFSKIENILYKKTEERASYCIQMIPWKWERTKSAVRLPRKACMSLGWSGVKDSVVGDILSDPLAKRFNISSDEIYSRMNEIEDSIKDEVELKHF